MNCGSRVLVLAGTWEARQLCLKLGKLECLNVIASLAGVLRNPTLYPVPIRTGGFGGYSGLRQFMCEHHIEYLIDATHPFATHISMNAQQACIGTYTQLIQLDRPQWIAGFNDRWVHCANIAEAIDRLPKNVTVLASLGNKVFQGNEIDLFEQRRDINFYLRVIEKNNDNLFENVTILVAKPPFSFAMEMNTIQQYQISCLLCRNSGGELGKSKLEVAGILGLPVYLIKQPSHTGNFKPSFHSENIDEIVNWIYCNVSD